MAFIDTLREPLDPHRSEKELVKQCIRSIQSACSSAHLTGKNRISGYLYDDRYDDVQSFYGMEGFGANSCPQMYEKYFFNRPNSPKYDLPYVKKCLDEEIGNLGFTSFRVEMQVEPVMKRHSYTLIGSKEHYYLKKTNVTGTTIRVDISW